jgi:hypothetical protein
MSINAPLDVAAVLDAHSNFKADGASTHCNTYACAFLGMRGLVIPCNMSANQLADWFSSPRAVAEGWRKATHEEALRVANAQGDVVAVAQHEPHGHIGVCLESLPGAPGRLCVSAAGKENFVRAPLERSFGELQPSFFVNVG